MDNCLIEIQLDAMESHNKKLRKESKNTQISTIKE